MREPLRGSNGRIRIAAATDDDRKVISGLRHEVYASELGQHSENSVGELRDGLDEFNVYIVARSEGRLVGFVSITPPGGPAYSIDKYLSRDDLPFEIDDRLYEVRLLTVVSSWRGTLIGPVLMFAAFRWAEEHGATRLMAIGRREVMKLYLRAGMTPHGRHIESGAVSFELMSAPVESLRRGLTAFAPILEQFRERLDWALSVPFHPTPGCLHGGAFFEAIGDEFVCLDRRHEIINADVLDAWFPPSPKAVEVLEKHLPWLMRTSPPIYSEGMGRAIARARGVEEDSILPGAGSSDLMFLALQRWLGSRSRVLILDPTYAEYAHLFGEVLRCQVDRFRLSRDDDYEVDLAALDRQIASADYDLVVLVNPNSPTGRHIERKSLKAALRRIPPATRVWLDETYVEYAGAGQSLEAFAAGSENVVVCKSMSKVYALSGLRAAYLCASPRTVYELREATPPWAVSLLAQTAAVMALQDSEYYAGRYEETRGLRERLAADLSALGTLSVVPSVTNFLLCHLPTDGPEAATVVDACRSRGLYIRDLSDLSEGFMGRAFRVAVKDADTNRRMVEILRDPTGLAFR